MGLIPKDEHEKNKVVPLFQSGDYFFHRGIEAYRKNHLHRAVKLFERAVKITSTEPVFHVQLAAVLSEVGEYERSNEILQNVLDDNETNVEECYFFMANNYAYLGLFERAERMALRYLETSPNERFSEDAKDLLELLRSEREEEDWEEFDDHEDELIAQHERACSLLRQGKLESSIELLKRIIEMHPTYWAAYNHLAEAYFRLGDEKAFEISESILEKDPGNLFTIANLAVFYTKKGKAKKAEPFIKSLQRVYPIDGDHYVKVAETLCVVGEYQLAYERLKELGRWEFELRPDLLYTFGVAMYHVGKIERAQSVFTRAADSGSKQAKRLLEKQKVEGWSEDLVCVDIWVD
ncbi:tetratricopeptide repeat protein [Halalkalibacter krulwichiae]|uniref:Tetratricopeptide repeat protein n=1 Tax=Halalkalibacter krulwichiae TaxID=199441 RepID=A0A1X9MLZ7_9BACI|nr:tetratricopeptide repeat protein [Halalkalibacter krulwichiae]ARK32042.1 tetratricopeptide repeat protein [Halalkalibacter krulwichiae]